ncbi:MAG: ABC transporter substrate-binding protein [Thermomicrobiales bacterium]
MTRRTNPAADILTRAEEVSIVNALTRRGFIGAASAILAASAAGSVRAEGTPEASPTSSPVTGVWPRTIHGSLGDVTIEAKPTRVAAVSDWFEVDYLMAQGVRPLIYGFTNRYGQGVSPWLIEAGGEDLETYDLEGANEPDLELIAAIRPDLIVADPYIAEQIVAPLNEIAPTVGVPAPYSGSEDWREGQIIVGQATGNEEAAAAAIAETEHVIAEGKARLAPYADRTVTIAYAASYNGGTLYFATNSGQEATLIRELGMKFAGATQNEGLSLEKINMLADVDILLSYDFLENGTYLEGNSLFQSLPVASNGQYEAVSASAARALFAQTTLSVRWVIPQLVDAITAAAEGRGKKVVK